MATAFLRGRRVRVLDWPPLSPDISLIENAWAELKRVVKAKRPRSAEQIKRQAKIAWTKLVNDRPYVCALFASMPGRMQAVVNEKGAAISY